MTHVKKIALALASISLVALIVLPLLVSPVDAAAVLESETTAQASLGDSFYIEARGVAGTRNDDFTSRALIKMYFEFTIIRNGTRGVMFEVQSGYLTINQTRYVMREGFGFAGRPSEGRFNSTIVFGFRFNMTGPDGEDISVGLLGAVIRNRDGRPTLIMRGHIQINDSDFSLVQRGIIHRIQT
jgi:hypothetical protein